MAECPIGQAGMTAISGYASGTARPSAARGLDGSGRDLLQRDAVIFAMLPEPLEGPHEVRLDWDADRATRGDDAEQDAGAVRALCAAREEHVEPKLREVLELTLDGRVSIGNWGSSMKRVSASQWLR